jgi:hypothetical protein
VRLPQVFLEPRPVHLPAQLHQRVACIHKPVQLDSEPFSLHLVNGGFGLHRFSHFLLVDYNLTRKKGRLLKPLMNNH